jgi:hypothetical protein
MFPFLVDARDLGARAQLETANNVPVDKLAFLLDSRVENANLAGEKNP